MVTDNEKLKLLKEFAGQAMSGMLANPSENPRLPNVRKRIINDSWLMATEMVAYYLDLVEFRPQVKD